MRSLAELNQAVTGTEAKRVGDPRRTRDGRRTEREVVEAMALELECAERLAAAAESDDSTERKRLEDRMSRLGVCIDELRARSHLRRRVVPARAPDTPPSPPVAGAPIVWRSVQETFAIIKAERDTFLRDQMDRFHRDRTAHLDRAAHFRKEARVAWQSSAQDRLATALEGEFRARVDADDLEELLNAYEQDRQGLVTWRDPMVITPQTLRERTFGLELEPIAQALGLSHAGGVRCPACKATNGSDHNVLLLLAGRAWHHDACGQRGGPTELVCWALMGREWRDDCAFDVCNWFIERKLISGMFSPGMPWNPPPPLRGEVK